MNNSASISASSQKDLTWKKIVLYFVIAYAITWAIHLAIPLFGYNLTFDFSTPSTLLYLLGILGPCAAALIVSARYDGKTGVKKLLAAGIKWRFGLRWYLFAICIVTVLYFINIGINIGSVPRPWEWLSFPVALIIGQVWIVVGEEYGWRGFALPLLQNKLGSLGAALVLGVLWASWHLPMYFVPGSPQYSASFISAFPFYVLNLTFWTIIMTMLYNKTKGSVLVCMLFHAFANIPAFALDIPDRGALLVYLYVPVVIFAIALLPRPFFKWDR